MSSRNSSRENERTGERCLGSHDLALNLEARVIDPSVLVEDQGQILGLDLDSPVNEARLLETRRPRKDVDGSAARDVIEKVVGLDEAPIAGNRVDVAGVDRAERGAINLGEKNVGRDRFLNQAGDGPLVGPEGNRRVGEVGRDVLEKPVGFHPRVLAELHSGNELLGTVDPRAVETELPGEALLEEQKIEGRGKSLFRRRLVEPDLGGVEAGRPEEALPVAGLTENDVHLPAIGHPSGDGCLTAEHPVRVLDAAIVLLPEFVHFRERVGIPPPPESLDEGVPLLRGLKVEESIALALDNDVGDFLLEPLPMPLGEIRRGLGRREYGGRQSYRPHRHSSCPGPL